MVEDVIQSLPTEPADERVLLNPSSSSRSNGIQNNPNDKPKDSASKFHLILATLACTIGSPLQIGLNTSLLNAPADVIKDFYNQTYHSREDEYMSSDLLTILWALTVAVFCVGGMLGGLLSGYLPHKYGRKNTLLWNNALAFVTAGLQAGSKYSNSYEMLIAGRVVAGINAGINSAVSPLYLAEISPVMLRGFCGTCHQVAITMGVLLGETLGNKFLLGTDKLWALAVAFPVVPAIYSLCTLTWCPESPRFLMVIREDAQAARKALKWFRRTDNVEEEMEQIDRERIELQNSPKVGLGDFFRTPSLRWPLIICIVLQMSQQFSGINAVIFYSTSIFESARLSETASQFATIATGAVKVVMTFISALIMDTAGRRTLHLTGLGGMCIFSLVLVITLVLQSSASWLSYISIVSVIIYLVFFAIGPGSIPWFIVAEMFTQGPRTVAVSVSVVVNWLCNFIVGLAYPILEKSIGDFSFLPFSVMLALFFVFTFLFVPETKGKTISEITMIFRTPDDLNTPSNQMPYSDVKYEPLAGENGTVRQTGNKVEGSASSIAPPAVDQNQNSKMKKDR